MPKSLGVEEHEDINLKFLPGHEAVTQGLHGLAGLVFFLLLRSTGFLHIREGRCLKRET